MGKVCGFDGEGPVPVLIINVEIEYVARNLVGAKAVGDLADLRFRSVTVARLLEAEGPQRRKRMGSGKVRVSFDHLLRVRTIDQVIVERAAFGAERIGVARLLAEVEPAAPCVVEKNPVVAPAANREEKRDALVDGIDRFLRTNVSIPEGIGLISAVEGSGFVAQSEIMLVRGHDLVDREAAEPEFGGAANCIGRDYVAGEIANHKAERIALNPNVQRRGAEADERGVFLRLRININRPHFDRLPARPRQRPPRKNPRGGRRLARCGRGECRPAGR